MDILYSMLTLALIYSTPIIIASLGGLFSERSGVVNIALEGLMMFGAFAGATATVLLEPSFADGSVLAPVFGLIIGALVGALISLIHAYLSVNIGADQVISGTAINLLAAGATVYLSQIIFNQQRTPTINGFNKQTVPLLNKIPIIGDVLFKVRYMGVILSGILAGLAGSVMVLTQDIQYTVFSIHGTGFIALAALIFGKWKPFGLLYASLFFGFSQVLSVYANDIPIISSLPYEFFYALPYVFTVIALVLFSSKAVGPKAAGEPFDKSKR
jgi:ABC-type uncharacterized transport system permease subunit